MIFERVRRVPQGRRFRGLWQRALFGSYSLALPAPGLVIAPPSGWFWAKPAIRPVSIGGSGEHKPPRSAACIVNVFAGRSAEQVSTMILPQVHLRKPCYDFSFL